MIRELVDRDFLRDSIDELRKSLMTLTASVGQRNPEAIAILNQSGVSVADLKTAIDEIDGSSAKQMITADDKAVVLPHDPVGSLAQSSLQEFYEMRKPEMIQTAAGQGAFSLEEAVTDQRLKTSTKAEKLFEKMSMTDIGWASVGFAVLVRRYRHKREFPKQPASPMKLAGNARIFMVGDWGSGVPRARAVGDAIRKMLIDPAFANVEQHVIHLGDVYYSGFQREYENRFLPYWPVRPGEEAKYSSWCLNANHDMYSGGHGYYDFLLADPRFARQQRSSHFRLYNDHWQILGLDTGWEEGDLVGDQAKWVSDNLRAAPTQKGILLSHHQLFSPYEGGTPKMEARLHEHGVLQDRLIHTWFWGHEHRCAIYEPRDDVRNARLIGHGGVPAWAELNPPPPGVRYQYQDFLQSGFEQFSRFGFAALTFNGTKISVDYVNELGKVHHQETIE